MLRPGPLPVTNLAAQIAAATGRPLSPDQLREHPSTLVAHLEPLLARSHVLLFVDQFEELFTLSADPAGQEAFASALMETASANDRLRVVVTLRDDFLVRAAQLAALRAIGASLQILSTPMPDNLMRILVEPARRGGYAFEDDEFPTEIVSEVSGQPGALALLSFTASRLWELRDRQAKQLTRRAYRGLGGVGGALAQHAESVLGGMPDAQQRVVRELFRHLVTAEGTRAVLSRDELLQVGGGPVANPVVEALINERLLTAMESPGGESIEVVHETLIISWPRLVQWRSQDAENARLRDQLRAAARQWDDRGRSRGMLWRADAVTEYRLWRNRYPGSLTAVEEAFGAASIADTNRGRRVRRGLLIAGVAALIVALIVFAGLRSAAQSSRARAQEQLIESYLDQAERELAIGDSFGGLTFLDGAMHLGADSSELRFMLARALEAVTPELVTLHGHDGAVAHLAFGADGSLVTVGRDGTLRRWSAAGAQLWSVQAHPKRSFPLVAVDPKGKWIASATEGAISLWTYDGRLVRHLEGHVGPLVQLAFTADGQDLVSGGFDGTVRVWDLSSSTVRVLDTKTAGRTSFAWAGDRLVIAASTPDGRDSMFGTWTRGDAAGLQSTLIAGPGASGSDNTPMTAAVSADGRKVAVGMLSGGIELWDTVSRTRLFRLSGHEGMITFVVFRADGALVSGSSDATIRVWDTGTGALLRTLRGHHDVIVRGLLDVSGHLVTSSADGTAKIWDTYSGTLLKTFAHGGLVDVAVSSDGERIATASPFGTTKIWRTTGPEGVEILSGPRRDSTYTAPWLSDDGSRLLRTGTGGGELWDLRKRRLLVRIGGPTTIIAGGGDRAYFADGSSITVSRLSDGTAIRTITAPFEIAAMCVDPSSGSLVVASGAPARLAIVGADRLTVVDSNVDGNIVLACEPRGVAAFGTNVAFFALPELRRLHEERLPE